jgi:hypothetical protein
MGTDQQVEPTREWQPANEIEHELANALTAGDVRGYAQTVLSAPLYLPVPPDLGTEGWRELVVALGLTSPHVQAFTSLTGMSTVLGPYATEYREGDFATLARFWPDPDVVLALNPGLPISTTLPLTALAGLADGDESLVLGADVATAVAEEAQARIREVCLTELGAVMPVNGSEQLAEWETSLASAAEQGDVETFLGVLLEADVVVPTTTAVPDPDQITEPDFPWRTVSVGGLPVIPLLSSADALAAEQPRVQVPFLAALAGWPSTDHMMCLNPGSPTELFLSGEAIAELVGVLTQSATEA